MVRDAGRGEIGLNPPLLGRSIEKRRVQLRVRRLQLDEEIENLVVDLGRPGIRAVQLVDHDHRREPQPQRLPHDEPRLGHWPLGGVHQQQNAIHHPQDALDLAPEVGVSRCVHDVDLHVAPPQRGILRQNRDPALPLQWIGVQDAVLNLLVGPEHPGLA